MVLRRLLLYSVFLFAGCGPASRDRSKERRSRTEPSSRAEAIVFEEVNHARAARGVPPLVWHDGAADAARAHSREMVERRFFAHEDPQRGDLAKRLNTAGIRWTAIAENILQQRGYENSIHQAITSWLQSEGHRRNLLDETYTHTGAGIATGADGTTYYTQIFLKM